MTVANTVVIKAPSVGQRTRIKKGMKRIFLTCAALLLFSSQALADECARRVRNWK